MTSNFSKQKNEYDEEIKNLFEKVKILEQSLKTEKELIESKTEQIEKFLKLNKELSDLVTQNKNSYNSEKKQTERLLAELEVQKSENSARQVLWQRRAIFRPIYPTSGLKTLFSVHLTNKKKN